MSRSSASPLVVNHDHLSAAGNFQRFRPKYDKDFTHILCMDEYVLRSVTKSYLKGVKTSANIERLGEYDPKGKKDVFNPWMCPVSEFEKVYDHISRCIDKFVAEVL